MYLEYWGLKAPPFENAPSSHIFFPSPQHEEALSRLLFAVKHRKGVAMLTGEVGSGKTTVSRAFKENIANGGFDIRTITNPALNPVDFIRAVLIELGEQATSDSKPVLLSVLKNRLIRNAEQGVNTVLVIDEAHVIDNPATFEELRMLLNLQSEERFLITLILLGQPLLREKIFALKPLKERIGIKYHLDPLDVNNTIRYLLYRLKSAGASRGIFTKESIGPLYEYAEGLPLRTNSVCDRSLIIGMMRKAGVISSGIVEEAIEDLS